MKKLVFAAIIAFAVVIGGHQFYKSSMVNNLSEIMKANVEALAGWDEPDPNQPEDDGTCWDTITGAQGLWVRYCHTCTIIAGKPSLFSGKGKCG